MIIQGSGSHTKVGHKMAGIAELFKETWVIYKSKFIVLAALFFLPILFIFAGLFSVLVSKYLALILVILGFILIIVSQVAALFVIKFSDQRLAFFDYLGFGLKRAHSYLWVTIISNTLVGATATVTGVLLFVFSFIAFRLNSRPFLGLISILYILGVVLVVAAVISYLLKFIFSQIILIEDGDKGIAAVLKSKQYVQGVWWQIFLRLLPLALLATLLSLGTSYIANRNSAIGMAISLTVVLFGGPFGLIYLYQTFRTVKNYKGNIVISVGNFKKAGVILLMFIGLSLLFTYNFLPLAMFYLFSQLAASK